MLIHTTSHEGKKMAINTNRIISFETFSTADIVREIRQRGGMTGVMALGTIESNREAWNTAKTQISMEGGTTLWVRDDYQTIADKFSMVSEPAMPSR